MNVLSILRCVSLVFFFFLAAQGGYYILAQTRVLRELPATDFRHIRITTDNAIEAKLKLLYPVALLLLVALLIAESRQYGLMPSVGTALALALLIADFALAVTQSIPLNKKIFDAQDLALPALQNTWVGVMALRSYLVVCGFLFLIAAPSVRELWQSFGRR